MHATPTSHNHFFFAADGVQCSDRIYLISRIIVSSSTSSILLLLVTANGNCCQLELFFVYNMFRSMLLKRLLLELYS